MFLGGKWRLPYGNSRLPLLLFVSSQNKLNQVVVMM